jgi:hypothetical protein
MPHQRYSLSDCEAFRLAQSIKDQKSLEAFYHAIKKLSGGGKVLGHARDAGQKNTDKAKGTFEFLNLPFELPDDFSGWQELIRKVVDNFEKAEPTDSIVSAVAAAFLHWKEQLAPDFVQGMQAILLSHEPQEGSPPEGSLSEDSPESLESEFPCDCCGGSSNACTPSYCAVHEIHFGDDADDQTVEPSNETLTCCKARINGKNFCGPKCKSQSNQ